MFKGTGVALVTPFKNSKVDFDALGRIIEHVIAGGVDFLVSLGTTGEAITLSEAECIEVLRFTQKTNAGRLPIVVGMFGGNNTALLRSRIRNFDFSGFDAVMSSSPAYNKPPQEGIFQHYMALAEVSPLPVIIYNVPGRTSSNITAETTIRLANASEKFIAVKEASGNMVQGMHILKNRPDNFLVLSGDDPTALPLIGCGGDGCISVIANAFPQQFSTLIRSAIQDDFSTARKYNDQLLNIHPWLYIDGNPAGVKGALHLLGFCEKEVRLPLTALSEIHYAELEREIKKAKLV